MTPGPEYHERNFYELIGKPDVFSDSDLRMLRECLNNANFSMLRNHIVGKAQLRVDVELIESIRRFDVASATLMSTANDLTRNGLRIAAAALGVSVVSFIVAAIALLK